MIGTAANVANVVNNKNFDTTNLIKDVYVLIAEYKHIKSVLGETLYNDIDTNASGTGYATLKTNWLNNAIAYYTLYEALPFINLQIVDLGIMVNNTETAQQADSEQRGELRNSLLSHADALREQMMDYIEDNTDTYTKYDAGENKTLTTTLKGGMILDT